MVIRKIKEIELQRTSELFGIAFECGVDNTQSAEEVLSEVKNNPKTREDLYFREKWAAFDDEDNMMAFIATITYNVNFDGNNVKMAGVGGVSTLPQYRRHGAIRGCFNESLKYMYEQDFTLSYLYPFSSSYYKKFGYALCCDAINYSINLKAITRFQEADGQMYLVENGKYLDDVKKVYDDFADGYNLMSQRDDIDYSFVKNSNPAKDKNYIYVYKDKNGVAKGVMSFEKVKTGDKFNMECKHFYFSDMEGFKGLLNHTLAYTAYYENVNFKLPSDINISDYITEWALYTCKRENCFNGMVRVINVQKALRLAKYQGSGFLIMKITDNQIEQNNNTYEVVFENGKATNVEISAKPCDIELSINDFSRLIMGTHNTQEIKYIEQVKVNSNLDKISKVFYKKHNFIADYF